MMIHEDTVSCEFCGAEIVHLVCNSDFDKNDPDYYVCKSCIAGRDKEPEVDDTVHCCPDCERPNQFGELCAECSRERGEL